MFSCVSWPSPWAPPWTCLKTGHPWASEMPNKYLKKIWLTARENDIGAAIVWHTLFLEVGFWQFLDLHLLFPEKSSSPAMQYNWSLATGCSWIYQQGKIWKKPAEAADKGWQRLGTTVGARKKEPPLRQKESQRGIRLAAERGKLPCFWRKTCLSISDIFICGSICLDYWCPKNEWKVKMMGG